MGAALGIRLHVVQRRRVRGAVPDEVVAAAARAGVVIVAGNGVAQHLLAVRQAEREPLEQRGVGRRGQRSFVRQAAPGDVARILRPHRRQQRRTDGGAYAVRTDQHVTLRLGAPKEARCHAVPVLPDVFQRPAAVDPAGGEGGVQQGIQAAPGSQHLRRVALAQHRSIPGEGDAPRHRHAQRGRRVRPGPRQGVHQGRMRDDARPAPGQRRRRPFIHLHVPAGAQQQVGREQPAQRPADDEGAAAHAGAAACG